MSKKEGNDIVVAIDIGTAYSSYAFATKGQEQIPTCKRWNAKAREGISRKAPSSVLLKESGDVVAFGYEADELYCDPRRLSGSLKNYVLFQRLKVSIMEKKPDYPVGNDWEIPSVEGKMFSAKTVLSSMVSYLVHEALSDLRSLQLKTEKIQASDVLWIFTIPAIWDDILKHLMREAAIKAKLPKENITLALEPEAAAIRCLTEIRESRTLLGGTEFVLLDIGGSTIDVSVQKVRQLTKQKFRMEILLAPIGEKQGGTLVDDNFKKLLDDTFGVNVMDIFKKRFMYQFMELMREFEAQKRGDPGHIHLRLPSKLMKIYSDETNKNEVNIQIDSDRKFHIDEELDRINISETLFNDLFQGTIESIRRCLSKVFENPICKDITEIIAVGGLAESHFVRRLLEEHFPGKVVHVPMESDLAVLRGAVAFGMDPDIVSSRICRYTYGIKVFKEFKEGVHPEEKKVERDGDIMCKDCFSIKLRKGDKVNVDDTIKFFVYDTFKSEERDGKRDDPLRIDIYKSTEKQPNFTTDKGCQKLCQLVISPPGEKWPKRAEAEVHLQIANTELVAFHKDGGADRYVGIDFM